MAKPAAITIKLKLPAETAAGLSAIGNAHVPPLAVEALAARVLSDHVGPFGAMLIRGLSPLAKSEAAVRVDVVQGWHRARQRGGDRGRPMRDVTAEYLAAVERRHGLKLSRSRLYLWDRRFAEGGAGAMLDGRRQRSAAKPHPFLAEVARQTAAARSRRPITITEAHRRAIAVARYRGWEVLSLRTAARFIRARKMPAAMAG